MVSSTRVDLTFVDGAKGDDDLIVNRLLIDQGGPGKGTTNSVQLVRFDGRRAGRAVVLAWETASEIKHAGCCVLREEPGGRVSNLAPRLIPPGSPGGELGGARYSFTDWSAPRSATRYWLEDVDTLGHATRHGPALAPAYHFRPTPAPVLPDGVLNGLTDQAASAVDAAAQLQGEDR